MAMSGSVVVISQNANTETEFTIVTRGATDHFNCEGFERSIDETSNRFEIGLHRIGFRSTAISKTSDGIRSD